MTINLVSSAYMYRKMNFVIRVSNIIYKSRMAYDPILNLEVGTPKSRKPWKYPETRGTSFVFCLICVNA